MRHGAIEMALVKTKLGEDAMAGYDWSRHQSPDRNYVPGYGQKAAEPHSSASSASSPSTGTKRDSLSNLWHIYAKNHSAEPYTEYHKAHNANIFNHVKEHYGVEVAKAMHGHAEALRQGHIYSIRKKYNIMESTDKAAIHAEAAQHHRLKMLEIIHAAKKEMHGFTSEGFSKHRLYPEYQHHADQYLYHLNKHQESLDDAAKKPIKEDLENKDKPKSAKQVARKLITDFKNKKLRNRKRLRKVSDVYAKEKLQESVLTASGEQKFNELKEHPFVKNSFSVWHNPTSYSENHHAFQTKLHTFPANGSTHELRAAVRPSGEHEVTFISHHKNGLDSIHGTGTGSNFHEAITNARANHFKNFSALKAIHPVRAKGLFGLNNQFD